MFALNTQFNLIIMNAKEEFLNTAIWDKPVLCAYIQVLGEHFKFGPTTNLPVGYTQEQYESFLDQLDFDYDNGYGIQSLDGCIWFNNGDWAIRGEYDGSEWWSIQSRPEIPDYLNTNT